MNIPMKIKTWQEMTPEERDADHKKPHPHWTVRRMLEANERMATEEKGWGMMTVADLVTQLVAYPPHTEVIIRDSVGLSGVANYEIEIQEGLILADYTDDYEDQRKQLLAGEVRGKNVIALTKSNYEAETVDPHEAEEYKGEE